MRSKNRGKGAINSILMTFLMAMVPIVELRGAIPAGVVAGLDIRLALIVAMIGNMVPVPFIIIFFRRIIDWMKKKSSFLGRIAAYFEERAEKNRDKVLRYELLGLMILVAIPLPGTGAWTGAMVAAILDMRLRRAVPAIAIGVAAAGIIVTAATYGISTII